MLGNSLCSSLFTPGTKIKPPEFLFFLEVLIFLN